MAKPVPLRFEKHGNLRLQDSQDFSQYKTMHLVPVVFHEFYTLATEFPLVFVRNSERGDFVPVAMMGLTKEQNLYCQESRWDPVFVPSTFTLAPLSLHRLDDDKGEAVVAIDEQSPLLGEDTGEPLFQATGEYTDYLQQRIDQVIKITRQSLQSRALCDYLASINLFKTRALTFQSSAETTRYEVEGVYTIDEERLDKLGDDEFLELRKRGLIPLLYAHLTSLHQFRRLLRRQDDAERSGTAGFSG